MKSWMRFNPSNQCHCQWPSQLTWKWKASILRWANTQQTLPKFPLRFQSKDIDFGNLLKFNISWHFYNLTLFSYLLSLIQRKNKVYHCAYTLGGCSFFCQTLNFKKSTTTLTPNNPDFNLQTLKRFNILE